MTTGKDAPPADDTPRVSAKGIAVALLISFALGLVASELLLRVVMPEWREFYSGRFITTTTVPGYGRTAIGRPNFDGHFAQNNGDFRIRIRLNGSGLRNPEPIDAADGRVWIVGDSMAFGWGVEREEMYSTVLAQRLGMPVYNLANPGTDVCGYQAMIARIPDGVTPRAVVVGLILENDLRMYDCAAQFASASASEQPADARESGGIDLIQVKYYLTQHSALYNFFAVSLKRVAVVHSLLVALDLVKKPHVVINDFDPDRIPALARSVADELVRLRIMLPQGTPYYVLIAPTRFEIRDGTARFRALRTAVVEALERNRIPAIDPIEDFRKAGFEPTHFVHDGHWSPLGHRIAADNIAVRLRADLANRQ